MTPGSTLTYRIPVLVTSQVVTWRLISHYLCGDVIASAVRRFIGRSLLVIRDPLARGLAGGEMTGTFESSVQSIPLPVAFRFPIHDFPLRPAGLAICVVLNRVAVYNLSLLVVHPAHLSLFISLSADLDLEHLAGVRVNAHIGVGRAVIERDLPHDDRVFPVNFSVFEGALGFCPSDANGLLNGER